jgi:hypothetical protein
MALPNFYNQGDQDIYNSGQHFIPQEDTRLNYTPSTTLASTVGNTGGITSTQAAGSYGGFPSYDAWLAAQGRGDSATHGAGGGKWGNLDTSNTKMFDKNVFSTDMVSGPPSLHQKMTGSFKPQQVQGYYNPTLGQYQTLEGKNINHLGINVKPMFASMLESMGAGAKKNKLFDHEIGAIEGTFTHGLDSGVDKIKEGWEEEKEKFKNIGVLKKWRENKAIKKEKRIADEIKAHNDAAAAKVHAIQDRAAGAHSSQVQLDPGGGGTWHGQTAAKERQGVQVAGPGFGKGSYFNQGGRAGYAFGRGPVLDENINVEGPNFDVDENVEMAETSPFEMRIDELMDTGMSWEEAYQIASEEFATAEAPEESLNQEGLASIV